VGGNGGQGGDQFGNFPGAIGGASGHGGTVTVDSSVIISTTGEPDVNHVPAYGILAQSRSGTGGTGGGGYIIGSGGVGGLAGAGGSVTVTNTGQIYTLGTGAVGIIAQSLGGAAGNG